MQIAESRQLIYEFTKVYIVPTSFAVAIQPLQTLYAASGSGSQFTGTNTYDPYNNFTQATCERHLDFQFMMNSWDFTGTAMQNFKTNVDLFNFDGIEQQQSDMVMNNIISHLRTKIYDYFSIRMHEKIYGIANGDKPYSKTGYVYENNRNVSATIQSGANFGGLTLTQNATI